MGGCRKLHNEELRNLCSLPNIIRVSILRTMRWTTHVVHMEEMIVVYNILVANCGEGDKCEDLGIDGRVILKWILG
jgi:hypothetical protein